jgi:hypothetical protein
LPGTGSGSYAPGTNPFQLVVNYTPDKSTENAASDEKPAAQPAHEQKPQGRRRYPTGKRSKK